VGTPTSATWVERLEVEGGFLDGLDLAFAPGLNAIIGARGTGKTSIIELIRFCIGAPAMTDLTATRATEHARAVLADGRVVLTLDAGGESIRVSRGAHDGEPEYTASTVEKPLVFAQNEIEVVAADEVGRRRLIDAFTPTLRPSREAEQAVLAEIADMTRELRGISQEVEALLEQQETLADVAQALARAEAEQQQLLAATAATKPDQERAAALDHQLSAQRVRADVLERVRSGIASWAADIAGVRNRHPEIESWPQAAGAPDPLTAVGRSVSEAISKLESISEDIERVGTELAALLRASRATEAQLADESRELRGRLEAAAGGAGAAARRVAELRQQAAQAASVSERVEAARNRLAEMQERRLVLLDRLDVLREDRFKARVAVAHDLTTKLGPEIEVRIERLAAFDGYANAIASALRGSQIRYNTVAPLLAKSMSPRELVEAVEAGQADVMAKLANIDTERASRIVSFLRSGSIETILGAEVDDVVQLCLLDGGVYKNTRDLSTGQRCTVVLAVLLQHQDRIVVIDQPEDHLDNAFVARTLVPSIRARRGRAQLIVSTHNPNIPVLGEAEKVIVLESDGVSGHVESAEALDDPASIKAITELMEGGLEALQRRALFYQTVASSDQ
jgi:ABC-type lipoprotein export system ATPase subunit